jgi:hypothetical protein
VGGLRELAERLKRDAPSRGIVVYLALGGALLGAVHLYAQDALDSHASAAVNGIALALYAGGVGFRVWRGGGAPATSTRSRCCVPTASAFAT